MSTTRYILSIFALVLMFVSLAPGQEASVEELASMPPPKNEDGTSVGDGNRKVILRGNTLYVLNYWTGLQSFDVSNPKQPKELGVYRTLSRSFNFIIDDLNRAFLASEDDGVYIIDISNPNVFVRAGNVNTEKDAIAVALENNILAVAEGKDPIEIFDISNVASPVKLGSIPVQTWVWSVNFVNGYLYAGSKDCCMYVYDISDPANPKESAHINMKQVIRTIRYENDKVYVAAGPGGILIFDVTDPSNPKQIGGFETGGYIYDVSKSGHFIFAANEKSMKLQIVSVEDPVNPKLVYEKPFPNKVYGVFKESGSVFIAADKETFSMRYNNAPKIEPIGDQKVDENQLLVFKVNASDPDFDAISLRAENLPEGAVFDPETATFSWTPTFEQSGVYKGISFIVTEKTESALSSTEEISIFVNHINRFPEIAKNDNSVIDENQAFTFAILAGTDPDKEDEGKLKHRIENLPENAQFDSLALLLTWQPTFEQSGKYELVAVVSDPSGLEARSPFSITVNHVDRPPVVEKITVPQSVDENTEYAIVITGTDPDIEDEGKYNWSAVNLPEGAIFDKASQKIIWTPNYEQSGVYPDLIVYLKTNNFSDSTKIDITVNHVNRSPVMNDIMASTVSESDSLAFTVSGTDPDKEDEGKLVFKSEQMPEGAVFDPQTQSFSWVPGFEQSGEYEIIFTIVDPSGLENKKSAIITVNHVNRPPKLEAIADKTVNENEILTFKVIPTDPDKEDQNNLKVTAADLPEGAIFDDQNTFSWTPSYDQSGEYTLRFSLSDGAGGQDEISVPIVVNHVNRPPVIDEIAVQTVDENKPMTFNVKATDPDVEDTENLALTAEFLPGGATFDAASATFNWTPTFDQAGEFAVKFTANDGAGLTTPLEVKIIVNNINRTPVWEAELTAMTVDENAPLNFTLPAASDPDIENKENLVYSAANLPDGASFDPTSRTLNWTPSFAQSGTYTIEFSVSDGEFELKKTLNVTVNNVNRTPEILADAAYQGRENEDLSFTITINDPDSEDSGKLTVNIDGLPQGASFDENSGDFSWTPGYDQEGSYNLTLSVSDPGGLSANKSFTINIENTNREPVIDLPSPDSVEEGSSFSLSVNGNDPDNDPLSFSLEGNVPSGMKIDQNGNISWNDAEPGTYNVTVVLSDDKGGRVTSSFSLEVTAKPVAPIEGEQ